MANRSTLSIAPYYGGKGRMANFIADRLDYDNTDIFVTPFGGMCRELLNKPRHKVECYNDYSSGLVALMTMLSDPDKASKFIRRLYDETEPTEEVFKKQKEIFDNAEIDLEEQTREQLRQMLIEYDHKYLRVKKDKVAQNLYELFENLEAIKSWIGNKDSEFIRTFYNWADLYRVKKEQGYLPRPADMGDYVSEMDLAIATYVTFKMSRDGMGQVFSDAKFKTTDQYSNQVLKLYECAERLEGIHIFQIDALDFFRQWRPDGNTDAEVCYLDEWINDPRVMMYCDPSYISVESEAKLLKDIDIDKENSLSDAISKKYNGKKFPKNLGEVYARSFGYADQELFLRCIQNAKSHIMVSNYDLVLYNKYLNESTGWRREEFITSTSVGGKANNSRIEVIWYNY